MSSSKLVLFAGSMAPPSTSSPIRPRSWRRNSSPRRSGAGFAALWARSAAAVRRMGVVSSFRCAEVGHFSLDRCSFPQQAFAELVGLKRAQAPTIVEATSARDVGWDLEELFELVQTVLGEFEANGAIFEGVGFEESKIEELGRCLVRTLIPALRFFIGVCRLFPRSIGGIIVPHRTSPSTRRLTPMNNPIGSVAVDPMGQLSAPLVLGVSWHNSSLRHDEPMGCSVGATAGHCTVRRGDCQPPIPPDPNALRSPY